MIQTTLRNNQDRAYKAFVTKLTPTVDPETILGVRTPFLRAYAKEIAHTPMAQEFLAQLPHATYEENNLHAFLIERIKDLDACYRALEAFLPYVNNWATGDCMAPKILAKDKARLYQQCQTWIQSDHVYTVRYGIRMLMTHFLDKDFSPHVLQTVAAIRSQAYYINMMIAWFFATALAKQFQDTLPFLQNRALDAWVHKKTIQKAIESYRVSDAQKQILRALRTL